MLCICPQCDQIYFGGAFVPLRGGSSENVRQKAEGEDADISDNAQAAYLQTKKTIIFRGEI